MVWWSYGKSLAFSVPRLVLRYISRVVWGSGGPTTTLSRIPWSGCPAVNLSRYPLLSAGCRWFKRFTGNAAGRTSKMTPTWLQNVAPKHPEAPRSNPRHPEAPRSTSYGKSLAVSVVVRWLPVAPRRFKPAPRALLRLSGGPTATLSRFPWSGGPTLNLSRFPSLGWSVLRSISRVFVDWWSYGKSLAFSVPQLVLR